MTLVALSPELTDIFQLEVLSKQISYMLLSCCASFSCNSIRRSGCSALHGVNHNLKKNQVNVKNCGFYNGLP